MINTVKLKGVSGMADIFNKANFYQKQGFEIDVTKPKDVLGKETVKVKDILSDKDKKVNKMSDVFPQSAQTDENDFLS